MTSSAELIAQIKQQQAGLNARLINADANNTLGDVFGQFIVTGCKVTEGPVDTDMIISLEGAAVGDEANANPNAAANPQYSYQYANKAILLASAYNNEDTTATVDDAPATGEGRYDIAYIFSGPLGPGFAVATGSPAVAVKTDFDANTLDLTAYPSATGFDPALPVGAYPVARIYVEDVFTGVQDARIADLRTFLSVAGGSSWGDAVDAVITPDADGTRNLATTGTRFATGFFDALDITNNVTVGGTVDGRDIAADGAVLDAAPVETPGTSVVTITAGTGTITLDAAFDTLGWVQVGGMVNLGGWLKCTAISAPTGAITIGPIPTCSNLAEGGGLRRVDIVSTEMNPAMVGVLTGLIAEGATTMEVWYHTGGSLISPASMFSNTSELFISITYPTSD